MGGEAQADAVANSVVWMVSWHSLGLSVASRVVRAGNGLGEVPGGGFEAERPESGVIGEGSLKLLTLDDGTQLAYEEAVSTGTLIEEVDEVMIRQRAYDLLKAYALSPSDSATFIKSAMEELPT